MRRIFLPLSIVDFRPSTKPTVAQCAEVSNQEDELEMKARMELPSEGWAVGLAGNDENRETGA
jgi:hypothetical protein